MSEPTIKLPPFRRNVLEALDEGRGAYNGTLPRHKGSITRALGVLRRTGLIDGLYRTTERAKRILSNEASNA